MCGDNGDWYVFVCTLQQQWMEYIDRDLGLRMYNMQHVLHSSILLDMWQGCVEQLP